LRIARRAYEGRLAAYLLTTVVVIGLVYQRDAEGQIDTGGERTSRITE
jgi:hypothetical protein